MGDGKSKEKNIWANPHAHQRPHKFNWKQGSRHGLAGDDVPPTAKVTTPRPTEAPGPSQLRLHIPHDCVELEVALVHEDVADDPAQQQEDHEVVEQGQFGVLRVTVTKGKQSRVGNR